MVDRVFVDRAGTVVVADATNGGDGTEPVDAAVPEKIRPALAPVPLAVRYAPERREGEKAFVPMPPVVPFKETTMPIARNDASSRRLGDGVVSGRCFLLPRTVCVEDGDGGDGYCRGSGGSAGI